MKTFSKYCLLVACLLGLQACGALESVLPKSVVDFVDPKGSKIAWDGFTVLAGADANLNSAVALDLVLVRDDAALTLVTGMSASKWFASRNDVQVTFPQGLRIVSVEVAPGQSLRLPASAYSGQRVLGVVAFANYLTPGDHRVRVDQLSGNAVAQLGARDFSVIVPPQP